MWRSCLIWIVLLGVGMSVQAQDQEWIYPVQPGDTLWDISTEYLQDATHWLDLQTRHHIADPQRLPPGLALRIPLEWLKVQPAPVRVKHVLGRASVAHADGTTAELQVGAVLTLGDEVRTAAQAAVMLEFADGSQLLVRADSRLRLDTVLAYGKTGMVHTRIRLLRGRSEAQVKPKRGAGDRFELETPANVSAVRGTEFRAGMDEDTGLARTEVATGMVAVSGAEVLHEISAGFGVLTKVGEPPGPPAALLPGPVLAELPAMLEALPLVIGFDAVADAVAYRIHISAADQPLLPVHAQLTADTTVQVSELADGNYVLHVRAIDAQGMEGLDGERAFILHANPPPPRALTPEADVTVQRAYFSWQPTAEAAAYRIQLADDPAFAQPRHDFTTDTPLWQPPQPLAKGVYYWRVAAVDAAGKRGPYSAVHRLEVNPVSWWPVAVFLLIAGVLML